MKTKHTSKWKETRRGVTINKKETDTNDHEGIFLVNIK